MQHSHQDIAGLCRRSSCGKDACHQGWSRTSETARHQCLACDCFVAYIRVASLSSCTAMAEQKNPQALR